MFPRLIPIWCVIILLSFFSTGETNLELRASFRSAKVDDKKTADQSSDASCQCICGDIKESASRSFMILLKSYGVKMSKLEKSLETETENLEENTKKLINYTTTVMKLSTLLEQFKAQGCICHAMLHKCVIMAFRCQSKNSLDVLWHAATSGQLTKEFTDIFHDFYSEMLGMDIQIEVQINPVKELGIYDIPIDTPTGKFLTHWQINFKAIWTSWFL